MTCVTTVCVNNGGDVRRQPFPIPHTKQHKVGPESVPVIIFLDVRDTFGDQGENNMHFILKIQKTF